MKSILSSLLMMICVCLLGLVSMAHAADPTPPVLTMEQCIEKGLRDNPQLESFRRSLQGAEYGVSASKGRLGPSMTANYRYLRNEHGSSFTGLAQDDWLLNLNLHQPLFAGFRLLSSLEKAGLGRDQAVARLEKAGQGLILNIQQSFLSLLQARENVRSAGDSLVRLQSQLKVTSAFYDVGLRPKLDVLQAQVDVARAEQQLLTAETSVQVHTARLNSFLAIPVEQPVEYVGRLDFIPFSRDLVACLDTSLQHRPDMDIAQKSIAIAKKDANISASGFYPQVGADVDYYSHGDTPAAYGNEYGYEQNNDYWTATVTLSYALFESGSNYNDWKQARERVHSLEQEYLNLKNDISFEVKSNFDQLKEAAERIGVTKKALVASNESYRMAKARYEAQVGTNTDVLDAQANVTRAEADVTQAFAEYQQALSRLYYSMGVRNPGLLPG